MLLGPIFRTELLRTARRGRYYILRFVYGAILLLFFGSVYAGTFGGAQSATIAAVAMFALETFFTFVIVQLVTVLVLIPPLFGGTIADEKQRKTLHYLMASQLTASEIVVDKVLGRLPHLAILLAMGLPIVSILGLIGGVPPEYVVGAFTLVGALTWLVAAVGIYFSLRATNTTRALVSTIVALCLFNGYPFIFVFWFIQTISWDFSFTLLGFMPRLAVAPLVSPDFVAEPWWGAARPLAFYVDPLAFVPIGRLVLVVFYVVAAAVLTWRVVVQFDRWLDRPRLSASD
jgi:ABC-type transport system involved in multi-copper enzyme maturation permease subunit